MNEPTIALYSFATADTIRLSRYVQRWSEAGIPAIKALSLRILHDSVPDLTDVGKCQRKIIAAQLSDVDWFRLGYALTDFLNQKDTR